MYAKQLTQCLALGKNPVSVGHQRYDRGDDDDDGSGRVSCNCILNT